MGALHDAWAGWIINERTAELVSPNGYSFEPGKLQVWPILCEQARFWRDDFSRRAGERLEGASQGAAVQHPTGESLSCPALVEPQRVAETPPPPTALFVVPLAALPMAAQQMAMAAGLPELRNAGVYAADPAMLAAALAAQLPAQMQSLPPPSGSILASLCNHIPHFVAEPAPATSARASGPDSNTGLNLNPQVS
jgi:hypothetical protein